MRPNVTVHDKGDTIVHAAEDDSSKINHCPGTIVYLTAGMSVLDIIGYSRHVSPSGQSVNYTSLLSFRTILGSVMDLLGTGRCVILAELSTLLFAMRVPPKQISKTRIDVSISATSTLKMP